MLNSQDSDACPVCGGLGFVTKEDEEGRVIATECECLLRERQSYKLRFANLPEMLVDAKLKNFTTAVYEKPESKKTVRVACNTIKQYLENFEAMKDARLGLYIYSKEKGSGKTRMAASIVNELIERGYLVKFATSSNILREIKYTWKSGESESRLLDQLALTDVLVIDDFGTEQPAPWIDDRFYQIVNDRYIGGKVTIYTSNESIDTLNYDPRIKSRIKEVSYQIAFPEESVRDHIADKRAKKMMEDINARK